MTLNWSQSESKPSSESDCKTESEIELNLANKKSSPQCVTLTFDRSSQESVKSFWLSGSLFRPSGGRDHRIKIG